MTSPYHVREATLADAGVLAHQRIRMFADMGVPLVADALDRAFRAWLADVMPSGAYQAWLVETDNGEIVAGGGITILPWPPGPRYMSDRLAFVYNVYTEPAHRRRGLARVVMDAIHAWCREAGIGSTALNASRDGQPLYQAMGYGVTPNPMMFCSLTSGKK